jgi:glyoxylase-like metal-dependent hydrolase (beta-lactamase superfamily II)
MKRQLILSAIVAAGVGAAGLGQIVREAPVAAQGATLPGITDIEKVADNVYKIFGAGGNTVVFVMDDGVALVDTKLPGNGEAILAQVRKITDKPVTMIINSHSHPDHVGSNQFFKDAKPDVAVIAQANTAARMAKASGPFPANPATREFGDKLTLGSGKDQVDLYYFGAGHTDGDAFVVFPAARTVMMGDIMAWSMAPLIDPGSGGSALKLADTMEKAVAGIQGVDKVIEGHGYVTDWQRLRDYTAFSRALVDEAKKAVAAGKEPKDVVAALEASGKHSVFLKRETLPGLEYGGTGRSRAQINAIIAMQELRGETPKLIMNLPPEQQ